MGRILEATDGFVCEIDGERFTVNKTTTRIDSEHILAKRYPNLFRPVEEGLTYPVEAATDNPGEARERARTSSRKTDGEKV